MDRINLEGKNMAHHCKALVLRCFDYRLAKPAQEYLEQKDLLGTCDTLSVAGGVKSLTSPDDPSDKVFLLRQIYISVILHKIQEIVLINHTDCGAYGGSEKFNFFDDERRFHIQELREAKALIRERYPALGVKMVLARIESSGKIIFEEINSTPTSRN